MRKTTRFLSLLVLLTAATGAWAQSSVSVYSNALNTLELFSKMTNINANGDGTNGMNGLWLRHDNLVTYNYSSANAADDWLVTPGVALEAGVTYTIAIDAVKPTPQNSAFTETFEVKVGTGTEASAANLSAGATAIATTEVTTSWTTYKGTFTPTEDGTYYVGIHATSPANQNQFSIRNLFVGVKYYSVNLNDGELNPTTWTAKAGSATTFTALPQDVAEGQTVTLKYDPSVTGREVKSITAKVEVIPDGAIKGKFTVNASGKKVYFSQGNLQATYYDADWNDETPGTWSWGFAANQWDYVGGADYNLSTTEWSGTKTGNNFINGNGTMSENGTVDLFNWVGASAASNNYILTAPAYYGISNIYSPLSAYGNTANENLMHDWGECIGAGWRTLTMNEWIWILGPLSSPNPGTNCRLGSTVNSTENARFSPATVNTDGTGMKGLILFPDGLTIANTEGVTWGPINNIPYDGTNCTNCTTAGWAALAAKGCVFLPVTSFRFNQEYNSVDIPIDLGFYWSATGKGENTAYSILFSRSDNSYSSTMEYTDRNRTYGCAVRLVYDVE